MRSVWCVSGWVLVGWFVAVVGLSVEAAARAPDIEEGLELYLPMNEGQGNQVKDWSPNQYEVEMSKNPPTWVQPDHPKLPAALKFNGKDQYLMIDMAGQGKDIDSHTDKDAGLSICAWVKVIKTGTDAHNQARQPIVMKGNSGQWEFALYVYDNLAPGMSVWNCGGSGVSEPSGGNLGVEWHYQCGTFNAEEGVKVYLDADPNPVAQAPVNANIPCDGNRPVFIAHREDGQWLNAIIAEVRIWSRVIEVEEMELAMNAIGGLAVHPQDKLATTWGRLKAR